VFFGTDNDNFSEIRNWSDDSGSKFDFSISLIDFEDVISGGIFTFDELFHVMVDLISSEMNLD